MSILYSNEGIDKTNEECVLELLGTHLKSLGCSDEEVVIFQEAEFNRDRLSLLLMHCRETPEGDRVTSDTENILAVFLCISLGMLDDTSSSKSRVVTGLGQNVLVGMLEAVAFRRMKCNLSTNEAFGLMESASGYSDRLIDTMLCVTHSLGMSIIDGLQLYRMMNPAKDGITYRALMHHVHEFGSLLVNKSNVLIIKQKYTRRDSFMDGITTNIISAHDLSAKSPNEEDGHLSYYVLALSRVLGIMFHDHDYDKDSVQPTPETKSFFTALYIHTTNAFNDLYIGQDWRSKVGKE